MRTLFRRVKEYLYDLLDKELALRTLAFTKTQEIPADVKSVHREKADTTAFILRGTANHSLDIIQTFKALQASAQTNDRVFLVIFNSYYQWLYRLLNYLGLRAKSIPTVFLTNHDLKDITRICGFEVTNTTPLGFFPFRLFGLGDFINGLVRALPFLRWFSVIEIATLRPVQRKVGTPSISIIVPARNEAGTIPLIIPRLENLKDVPTQVVFVEGHSKDNTWQVIQDTVADYKGPFKLVAVQQTGIGKKNAVEVGLSHCTGDFLCILDSDLSVKPEEIETFYRFFCEGRGDFFIGNRMLYPKEDAAMRFLNLLGNVFFAKALGFVLESHISDSLCGTKCFSKEHLACIKKWNSSVPSFDPFGDFELIFPAAILGLGVVNVPTRYYARVYGTTNIQRFRDGWRLLKMTAWGFYNLKMGMLGKRFQQAVTQGSPPEEFLLPANSRAS